MAAYSPSQSRPSSTEPVPEQKTPRYSLWLFLLCSIVLFELCYLFLSALALLPETRLISTPIATNWPWTLVPLEGLIVLIGPNFASAYAPTLFAIILALLIGIYAAVMWALQHLRTGPGPNRRWLLLILSGTLLFGLTLLLQPMLFSDDVWTQIFSGRLLSVHGANPLSTAPDQFANDPFFHLVLSTRDKPNIFGPLWISIAALLTRISNDPMTCLLIFKAVALFSQLLACILIWDILGRIAPERQLSGTLLYAWNPLALIELPGNGHYEGLLVLLLLLGTWLYVLGQQQKKPAIHRAYQVSAFLTFGFGIGTNLITLLIAPLLIWFDLRKVQVLWRILLGIGIRALLMLIPALLFFLPLWGGAPTFLALTSASDLEHFVHAPVGLISDPLQASFKFLAQLLHIGAPVAPDVAADIALRASTSFIFVLIYLHLFKALRPAAEKESTKSRPLQAFFEPTIDTLLNCWGVAIFWYMVLVSGWFWPWYLLWLLWVITLQRLTVFTSAMLLLSGTALFIYPFIGFSKLPLETYQTAIIFGIPLCYLIGVNLWYSHWAERIKKSV